MHNQPDVPLSEGVEDKHHGWETHNGRKDRLEAADTRSGRGDKRIFDSQVRYPFAEAREEGYIQVLGTSKEKGDAKATRLCLWRRG